MPTGTARFRQAATRSEIGGLPVISPRTTWRAQFGVFFEDAHRLQSEPEIGAALQRSTAEVAGAMAEVLERGQRQGSIRADVPSLTVAWLVVSLIHARQFRRRFTPTPSPLLEGDLHAHVLETLRGS